MALDPQISVIIKDIEAKTAKAAVELMTEIHSELVTTTPVDIGWARVNWVPSYGAPYIVDIYRAKPDASSVGRVSLRAEAQKIRVALTYSLNDGNIYITNNVPYINRLNNGWSKQQPAGFVQRAIEKGLKAVKNKRF